MKTLPLALSRLAITLGATALMFSAWAQNQATLTPISRWPDYPLVQWPVAVRVAGSYAFVAGVGYPAPPGGAILRLLTLDVSTPSQPRYLSHVDAPTSSGWNTTSIRISGRSAYVMLGRYGGKDGMLAIFGLNQPAAPQLVGTFPLGPWASAMDVVGNRTYVAGGTTRDGGWFQVIDVSDPVHPTLESTTYLEGAPICVSVAGNYAYAGGAVLRAGEENSIGHMDIIDISDPSQPVVATGLDLPEYLEVEALAAEGSLLHRAAWGWNYSPLGEAPPAYEVFDLSDPLNPSLIGRCELAGHASTIRVVGERVYLDDGGLRIIEITDPHNPQVEALLPLVGGWGSDIFDVVGPFAYWHDGCTLRVLGAQDPTAPFQVGELDTGFSGPWTSVDGDLGAWLDGTKLRVFNLSNRYAPELVAAQDLPYAVTWVAPYRPLKVVGQCAYLMGGDSQGLFLQVLDLSNPSRPVETGRLRLLSVSGGLGGFDVAGNRAYVSVWTETGSYWLTAIDVANPASPTKLGQLALADTPGPPQAVGDFVYLVISDLVVVDMHNPSQMVKIGQYHATNGIQAFQVVGQYAYALVRSDAERAVHVVDLADPAKPTRVGRFLYEPGVDFPSRLYVFGRYGFASCTEQELPPYSSFHVDILDLGDPTQPVKVGEYHPEAEISGMAMVGSTLYTSSGAGLTVLNFFNPNAPLQFDPPTLSGSNLLLSWTGGPGVKLQQTPSLANANWQDVPGSEGLSQMTLPRTDPAAFFRLMKP